MKSKVGNSIAIIVVICAGCGKEPSYSIIPHIALVSNGVKFIDNPTPGEADTLRISLRFTDGDGDLGLDSQGDTRGEYAMTRYAIYYADYTTDQLDGSPYSLIPWKGQSTGYSAKEAVSSGNRLWVSNKNGNKGVPGRNADWKEFFILNYKAKRTIPAFQSFPEFVKPYNCTKWEVITYKVGDADLRDTLSVEFRPDYYNIFVDIYTKNPEGTFSLFDPTTYFSYPQCVQNLTNGRFPILADQSKSIGPLNGVINYSVPSVAWTIFFGNKTLKLKVYILDRARHKSNVEETPEFTLQSIKGG